MKGRALKAPALSPLPPGGGRHRLHGAQHRDWTVRTRPFGTAAGNAGAANRRAAKKVLPVVWAPIVANGAYGTYLQGRGIVEKPGGFALHHALG
ncbi:hypothetical protein [Paeniglutamicibacter sp. Y32M11]|uniref:hypothetical protein n=1 Tax=Paeniglutamicibacter sp. Y32M11 TaxID=2853258 RepID=UPI001C531B4C|nr:hypothetical protein [Paeniglutamicibacter sp. Y32M11]QXQ08752.1 hypothetical protein KUF55_09335 [Paeniglutamicibacter sp. Y32M11]